MSWIWTPITIADGVEKDNPTKVDITAAVGRIRGFAVIMPLTASGLDAGIRVLAADRRLFPGMAEGADQWLYVQEFAFDRVYEDVVTLQEVAPVLISVQGHNKSGASVTAQVGIRLEAAGAVDEQFTATIASAIEALVEVATWPDVERQIRRLWTVVKNFSGGDNE